MQPKFNVVAIIQARVGSTRLPGKGFAEIEGRPMLWHVVNRVRRARLVNRTVVATSQEACGDASATFCGRYELDRFRGNGAAVLDRCYQTAQAFPAKFWERITAD